MKNLIAALLITGVATLVLLTQPLQARQVKAPKVVQANAVNISSVKRLFITGDVDVEIVQAPKSRVLFIDDGSDQVKVTKIANSLYVNAKNYTEGAKIVVYVDDIYRIEASGNAFVSTRKTLRVKYLQICLNDNAIAEINSQTEGLATEVKNSAVLKLKGSTDALTVITNKFSRLTFDRFFAQKTDMSSANVTSL